MATKPLPFLADSPADVTARRGHLGNAGSGELARARLPRNVGRSSPHHHCSCPRFAAISLARRARAALARGLLVSGAGCTAATILATVGAARAPNRAQFGNPPVTTASGATGFNGAPSCRQNAGNRYRLRPMRTDGNVRRHLRIRRSAVRISLGASVTYRILDRVPKLGFRAKLGWGPCGAHLCGQVGEPRRAISTWTPSS